MRQQFTGNLCSCSSWENGSFWTLYRGECYSGSQGNMNVDARSRLATSMHMWAGLPAASSDVSSPLRKLLLSRWSTFLQYDDRPDEYCRRGKDPIIATELLSSSCGGVLAPTKRGGIRVRPRSSHSPQTTGARHIICRTKPCRDSHNTLRHTRSQCQTRAASDISSLLVRVSKNQGFGLGTSPGIRSPGRKAATTARLLEPPEFLEDHGRARAHRLQSSGLTYLFADHQMRSCR